MYTSEEVFSKKEFLKRKTKSPSTFLVFEIKANAGNNGTRNNGTKHHFHQDLV